VADAFPLIGPSQTWDAAQHTIETCQDRMRHFIELSARTGEPLPNLIQCWGNDAGLSVWLTGAIIA
jgi:hypothetical protein